MYVTVEAEVNLDDFDEDDLIEHLEDKGYTVTEGKQEKTSEAPQTVRSLAKICEVNADYQNSFWREFFTDVLHIPFMSDTEDILNGIRNLIK